MRIGTILAALLVASCVLAEVTCITNQEFFDLVKDDAEDLESFDIDDPAINDDDDDDSNVIELPGNADDELDIEYLITKLDLGDVMENIQKSSPKTPNNNLGWWRRRRRRRRRPRRNPCSCRGTSCNCCLNHTFRVNLWFKKWKFRVNVCVRVAYLRRNHGFSFTITLNGRRVYHREVSLRRPPPLCFGVPGLQRFVRACIEIYNVNLRRKSLCLRVSAIINIKVKKFRFSLRIGCFRIPMMDGLAEGDAMQLLENLETTVENKETGEFEEISLSDLPVLYRQLQIETAEKYLVDENQRDDEEPDDLFFEPEAREETEELDEPEEIVQEVI